MEYHLRIKKKQINKYVLLPGDPARVLKIINFLENPKKVSENRGYLIYNGLYEGIPITVCSSGMGGPSIAIAIHELVNCGAKYFIRVGSCGSLQPDIHIGDVIVPKGAVRNESTTLLYRPLEYPAYPDKSVYDALLSKDVKTGYIHSHDGFYHKTNNMMQKFWSDVGLLCADFETAPLFIISEYLGVKSGSVLNVVAEYNKDVFISDKALEGERKSIMVALNAIKKLEVKNAKKNKAKN